MKTWGRKRIARLGVYIEQEMFKFLLVCFAFAAARPLVIAQADEPGFISIDCGSPRLYYYDVESGLNYSSDAGFTDRGESKQILANQDVSVLDQLRSVRSFPKGTRNCYTLTPINGKNNPYLIRAWFVYANYDGLNQPPRFDVYIGEDGWVTVDLQIGDRRLFEIIHTPASDYVQVCLQKTGTTTPFISALELRPMNYSLYQTQHGSLSLRMRWDFGSQGNNVRYPQDSYDRMWFEPSQEYIRRYYPDFLVRSVNTSLKIATDQFKIPSDIMSTAASPLNSSNFFSFSWVPYQKDFYLYLYFAEVEEFKNNESRRLQVYLNGVKWNQEFSPPYLQTFTLHSPGPEPGNAVNFFTINSTENSTMPPIVNAMEVYEVFHFSNHATDDDNVAAMLGIKAYYGLTKNWTGDPCRPSSFTWEGLRCDYDYNSSRIVALNLSSSKLTGSIAPHFADLTSIEILDLSNNNLQERVPDFLGRLENLKVLNLSGNNFVGPIPAKLREKSMQGLLSFSINEQPIAVSHDSGKETTNNLVIVLSIAASVMAVFCVAVILWVVRIRKQRVIKRTEVDGKKDGGPLEMKAQQLTYLEVQEITGNFAKVLGKGGFGTVYYGLMGDTEVAVKMLSPSSTQGYKEFQSEANHLMRVHHKSLTSVLGYCNEDKHIGIIYEYMANGNLQQHLSELSWGQRLRISVDISEGLQYLHHGCNPAIIHRDIKPTNILLTHKFQAKLSDFGLSRVCSNIDSSDVSINTIVGTPGYLDPECHTSYKLTEKSDVYSFGVVLLEIITGKPAIDKRDGDKHISEIVFALLEKKDIRAIVDKRLKYNFNIHTVWKVVELAMACVSQSSLRRPTMYDVLIELKECFTIETSNQDTQPKIDPTFCGE